MEKQDIRNNFNMTFIEWLQYITFAEDINVYAIAA